MIFIIMKLIVGLGNPGHTYSNNRHNLGFMVVDKLIADMGLAWRYSRDWVCYYSKSDDLVIVKPSTFMNKSGEAVRAVANYYKIEPKDVLVIYDELDIALGKLRLSFDGSAAGHNGVDSIIKGLGTREFARLRVGIGHPRDTGSKTDPSDYVLKDFLDKEKDNLKKVLVKAEEAANSFLNDGIEATMNRFN